MTIGPFPHVLVVGEALIDIVVPAHAEPSEHVGGSPANVALGLGRLGVPVRLRTALARDERGERIAAHLAVSAVDVDAASFVLDRTATAIARVDSDGGPQYEFDVQWRIDGDVPLDDIRIMHVGSLGCFLTPGADAVAALVRAAEGRAHVTFDPNVRPALIGERANAVSIVEDIASRAAIVKLSDEDAEWLYPGYDVDDVLDRLLGIGATVVAVTLGARGAALASSSARVGVAAPQVPIRDTVGAGDTFMASLVQAQAAGVAGEGDADALVRLGRRAAIAAALTVGRIGADLPTAPEVEHAIRADACPRRTASTADSAKG